MTPAEIARLADSSSHEGESDYALLAREIMGGTSRPRPPKSEIGQSDRRQ
jgi:hypothetical protein